MFAAIWQFIGSNLLGLLSLGLSLFAVILTSVRRRMRLYVEVVGAALNFSPDFLILDLVLSNESDRLFSVLSVEYVLSGQRINCEKVTPLDVVPSSVPSRMKETMNPAIMYIAHPPFILNAYEAKRVQILFNLPRTHDGHSVFTFPKKGEKLADARNYIYIKTTKKTHRQIISVNVVPFLSYSNKRCPITF